MPAQIIEIVRRHARSPENRRASRGAISRSGSTAEHKPGMRDLAGHAPDDAARLVLGDDVAAGGDDLPCAGEAVGTHAGQHQRQHLAAPYRGGGGEQRIDRRLAEIDRRSVVDGDHRRAVARSDAHVPSARRDIDDARQRRLAVDRLAHRRFDRARQMFGEDGGEGRRHMLGHEHRRARDQAAALAEHGVERLRPAGRGADQQDARRRQRHRPQHDRLLRPRRPRRQSGAVRTPRALAERADLLDELAAEIVGSVGVARRRRLGDVVGGAERQRLQADLGVPPRHGRRHDDDEVALLGEQQRQRRDAVELRHLDVEHDDVGIGALDLVDRVAAGAQQRDHVEIGLRRHPAREQAAHDGRVVDNHDAHALARGGVDRCRCG